MSSSSASEPLLRASRGTYCPARPTDLRGPCPLVNSLANHGYIPRDGRNVRAIQVVNGLHEVGLGDALSYVFGNAIFLEHKDPKAKKDDEDEPTESRGGLGFIWGLFTHPMATLFSSLGMRRHGQLDALGRECLDLTQLGLPGVVEHDISMTRKDIGEEPHDNITLQPDMVRDFLACSSDGKMLSVQDMVKFRRRRIETQRARNKNLNYGSLQHSIGCTEIALIMDVFGDGKSIRHDYAKAFFGEERLPYEEGWTKRSWWTLGIIELVRDTAWVQKLVGMKVE